MERARRSSVRKGWLSCLAQTRKIGGGTARGSRSAALALALALAGCTSAADLDTPHGAYVPEPTGTDTSTTDPATTATSTTGWSGPCDDSNVNPALDGWCSGVPCHGSVDSNVHNAPLWLFSPTRSSDFLNLPATTPGCSSELIIDTAMPEASLIVSSLRGKSSCGVQMPRGFALTAPEQQACIEQWALGLATAGGE